MTVHAKTLFPSIMLSVGVDSAFGASSVVTCVWCKDMVDQRDYLLVRKSVGKSLMTPVGPLALS